MHITWAAPANSIYFILFIIAIGIACYRAWYVTQSIRILGKTIGSHRFLYNTSLLRMISKTILWLTALLFIFLMMLHPSWNTQEETFFQEGRNLFIALDISRSMLAQDISPSRLIFAKQKIHSLVNALDSERVGLILFSGSSFIQCPLTTDRSAFFMFLDQIDIDTVSSGTTALDKAITQALQAFKQSGIQKNKLLVILTDGEDFSHDLSSLKRAAQQEGLTIFTFGIGTETGAPIPLFDHAGKQTGHLRDQKESIIISHLNEKLLKDLAQDLGGTYIHSTNSNEDVTSLTHVVQKHEKELFEEKKVAQLQEQYPWFALISFILLAIEWLL